MEEKRTAIIATLGCKVNQLESASFAAIFKQAGITIVSEKEVADIVVINTCAVTETAGNQSRQKIRRLLRQNPDAQICITGCYAEEARENLLEMEELSDRTVVLFGNSRKDLLPSTAIAGLQDRNELGEISSAHSICRLPIINAFYGRTRAYLRIQDGCNAFCSYCIVPYTRGRSRSLPPDEVITQAQTLVQHHHELILTGIHLGCYGADCSPQTNLATLVERLLVEFPKTRFRISSLEPIEIDDHLLSLFAAPNLMPHLHIPLQSGTDTVLRTMNRRYTTVEFQKIIDKCHQAIPNLAIGIDILAGFPGESKTLFQKSFDFLQQLDFSYLHVFPYSKRPGTAAATMDNQVPKQEKERRVSLLLQLSKQKRIAFYQTQLGTIREVLFEGKRDNQGMLKGFSDNYIDIRAVGNNALHKQCIPVLLESFQNGVILGIPQIE